MKNKNIEKLFEYACNGDTENLRKNIDINNSNVRYERFGKEHSLIMGAYRNNKNDTVKYLLSIGELPTDEEIEELNNELYRTLVLKPILNAYNTNRLKEIHNNKNK